MARHRAAIYARQSITREGSASLDVQIEACQEAAKRLKLDVVSELVEAPSTSGYRNRGRSRPKFQKLLDLIRAGEVDCVVAYKTDRLSRGGSPGWAPLVDAFEAAGRDPDRTVATTDGWVSEFEIGIGSAMDREESKKTSDRLLAVRAREAKEGIPRLAARRPYGYSSDMAEHIAEEVARIKEAARRLLAGESVWSIASDWNDEGVPTVTGRPWTVQTLTSILRSGRIAGLREHKGFVVGQGRWEPVIESDLHEQLVVTLATKRKAGGRVRTYPLVGLLRCGKCGGPLRSLARENGGRSYACRKGPGLDGCGGIRIQAQGVETYVRDLVCGMLADPDTRAALASLGNDGGDERGSLLEEPRAVETKRQRLIDLYTDGDIDRANFRARRDELDERARGIEAEMAQLVTAGDNPERLRSEASFAQLCGVSPIQASSGKTVRLRLNRGGDRKANAALYRIVIVRLCYDARTKEYAERRTAEGKSKAEIIRCLKRYVAREVYAVLTDSRQKTLAAAA